MAQLMSLPLTVSCFSKIQIGFTFLVLAHPGSPRQRAVKWVCVCVYVLAEILVCLYLSFHVVSSINTINQLSPVAKLSGDLFALI